MSMSQGLPCLFISGCELAQTKSILVRHGIKRIVSVTNRKHDLPPSELCQSLGISTKVFPIVDFSFSDEKEALVRDLFPWVREAEERGEAVLVHCQSGVSRSPSFVVAYLVWKGMDPGEAIGLVQRKHLDSRPWLNTMESFLLCVGSRVPDEHKDIDPVGPFARVK